MPKTMRARLGALLVCALLVVGACAEGLDSGSFTAALPSAATPSPDTAASPNLSPHASDHAAVDGAAPQADDVFVRPLTRAPAEVAEPNSVPSAPAALVDQPLLQVVSVGPINSVLSVGVESVDSSLQAVAAVGEPQSTPTGSGSPGTAITISSQVTVRGRASSASIGPIPVPPWADLTGSVEDPSNTGHRGVEFATSVGVKKIFSFYSSVFHDLGLTVDRYDGGFATLISAYSDDVLVGEVVIIDDGELRSVSVYTR